jgi:hypothetical protein
MSQTAVAPASAAPDKNKNSTQHVGMRFRPAWREKCIPRFQLTFHLSRQGKGKADPDDVIDDLLVLLRPQGPEAGK